MNLLGKDLRNAQLLSRLRGAVHTLVPVGLQIGKRSGPFPEIERDGLRAQCLRDWPQEEDFTQQWDALSRNGPAPQHFLGPIWQKAVAQQLIAPGSLRLILVWRGATLKAVFPLFYRSNATLETPGRWLSDYLDPPMDPSDQTACWSIFLELLAQLWDWSISAIVLPHIRQELPCRKLLNELAPMHGMNYDEIPTVTAARIALPESFDAYMAQHSSAERKNTLRKVRKATTQANAKLVEITEAAQGMEVLKLALDQMEAGKKRAKAGFIHKVVRPLLLSAGPALIESGWLKPLQLQLFDAKPAATLIAFSSKIGPLVYNVSYDEALKEWSPGAVAFAMAIEQAIARKEKVFDLLRGGEEYKKRMHASLEPLYRITLTSTGRAKSLN